MMHVVLGMPGHFVAGETASAPVLAPGEALCASIALACVVLTCMRLPAVSRSSVIPASSGHELGVESSSRAAIRTDSVRGDRCSLEPYLNCGRCSACRRGLSNCCAELKVLGVHMDGGMRPMLAVPAIKLHRSAVLDYDQLALVETLAIGAHAVERASITRTISSSSSARGPSV